MESITLAVSKAENMGFTRGLLAAAEACNQVADRLDKEAGEAYSERRAMANLAKEIFLAIHEIMKGHPDESRRD